MVERGLHRGLRRGLRAVSGCAQGGHVSSPKIAPVGLLTR